MKHLLDRLGASALALFLLAFAMPAQAAEATKISDVAHSVFFRGGSGTRGTAGTNGGHYTDRYFNGNFTDYTYCNAGGTTELVVDVSHIVTDPDGQAYVTDVLIGHQGNAQYSLYYTNEPEPENLTTYASDPRTWTPIAGADHVQEAGTKTYGVNDFATAVKYVFNTCPNWTTHLAEIEVQGYEYVPPKAVKISAVGRSVFFRGGSGTRGAAGTNGGHYSDRYFNGDFTDYTYCNGSGVTELVIPTTGLDDQGNDTGVAWYVTDFKVGHQGNAQYSLYYTTEAEPANLPSYASDPRTWTLIAGADHVQEAGTKTFGVNAFATAVKYVFNTCPNWTTHLAEVEVWAMDPSSITCLHPNMTDDYPAWAVCTAATCTENAFEERFCPDCGARFEREVPLSKLGHDFVATLTTPGSASAYGSGYVECSRCNEFHLVFDGDTVDLTTLGGPPIQGVVQYTDLTVSSTGAEDGGVKPIYLMDGYWDNGWGHAWYSGDLGTNEWVQYAFGTTIDLTKIEYSVINESQTVYFSSYDPATGEETLLRTIPIKKDTTEGAPGYQRKTEMFFGEGDVEHVFVDAVRMRIGDYVDPETGEVTRYIGYNYGAHDRHIIVCEFHPWGTIEGAGMTAAPVAMIGDSSYMSIAAAIASITNDTPTTIVLQKSTTEDVVIPTNRTVTINLNGNSITNDASDTITVYGTLTLQDAAGHGEVVALGEGNAAVLSTNSVAIASGTYRGGIEAADGGTFSISGGWFDAPVPVEYVAAGKAPTTVPENGLYTVKTARTVTFDLGAEANNAVYTNLVVATGETVAEPPAPALTGYVFNEWRRNGAVYDFTNTLVTANFTLVANWTTNQYDVLWMSEGSLFASNRLDYGAAVVAPDPAPTKAADAQYTYWFAGWDVAPDAMVSSNATYTAVFTNTVNQYSVAFEWHDGAMTNDYAYGTAAADVAVPRDPPTYVENGTIYTFTGWSAAVADVTGAAIYTAQYSSATAVAQIVGGDSFATLAAAVSAASDGNTVLLLGDVTLDARVEPNVGTNTAITIDLGGNTITRTGTSGNGSAFDVKSGSVVITNGVIDCTQNDADIAKDGVYAITSRSGSTVTLADLTITVDSECGACAYPFAGSTMTIESGTYANVTTTPYRYNTAITGMAVNQPNNATQNLIIKGGSFSKYDPQLGDDSGAMTDFTDDGFVAIFENGNWVVQPGYNVTFDANGGSPAPAAQRVAAGGTATAPADPAKEGYEFDGWTLADAAYDFNTVLLADIELVASWEAVQTVEVKPDAPVEIEAESQADAEAKADTIPIVIDDADAAAAGQADVLKKVVAYDGATGKYVVKVEIDEEKVDAEETVAEIVAAVAAAAVAEPGTSTSVSIPAASVTPGLYYSVSMVTDLAGADWAAGEGDRELATGSGVTLSVPSPSTGNCAFYVILVNMTDK